jgi:hypothetical protein
MSPRIVERWRIVISKLATRGDFLAIRSFAQMTLSDSDDVREVMRQFIDDEQRYRKILQCPNAQFRDWGEEEQLGLGTPTLILKKTRACKKLGVPLKVENRQVVIKTRESEIKTNTATRIGRFLTQKVVRSQKIASLLTKEKYGAPFKTLKGNMVSNKILTDAKTTKSDAFFGFTVAARADLLLMPANIEQLFDQPRTNCHRCTRELKPTLAHILNGCRASLPEMTKRHNKVVQIVSKAIQKHMPERLESEIGENTNIKEQGRIDEVRNWRPDLSFVAKSIVAQALLFIDIQVLARWPLTFQCPRR